MTSIPPRIMNKKFDILITHLKNQILKCDVIVNVCEVYDRIFDYDKEDFYIRL